MTNKELAAQCLIEAANILGDIDVLEESTNDKNNTLNLDIWGREIKLRIDYDCFKDENITQTQRNAYKEFVNNSTQILKSAKSMIEKYCKNNYASDINDNFENIFKYISPKSLYIKRSSNKRIVGLLCNFKLDPEHGLVVYVENGKVTKIGSQDIIL